MSTIRLTTLLVLPATLLVVGCEEYGDPDAEPGTEREAAEQTRTQQRTVAYGEWDDDDDDVLGLDEFRSWWEEQELFSEWDLEGGEDVSREEFATRVHAEWDANDDDVVSEAEWRNGIDVWFAGEVDGGTWSDWDGDGDSDLDANEVAEGLESNGLYDRIDQDQDGVVDDEELSDWFFDIFDVNDDDRIDTTEWDAAESDVLDG